jgi:D-glycero-D-manno-heptose 1,7-bisphosphate phosphatase
MPTDKIKVAFLDRDGVINKEVNYLYKIEDFEYTDSCIEGLKNLQILGYEIIIITNQAGIAKGYYSVEEYQLLTKWYINDLNSKGISILDVLYCPHHQNGVIEELSIVCSCRKPKPGMLIDSQFQYNIDMVKSFLIGDKETDIIAAENAGVAKTYLVSSGHELTDQEKKKYSVYSNLFEVSLSLLNETK